MNVDTAIQNLLFNSAQGEIEDIAYLANEDREKIILLYQEAYAWTESECEEFLDNACLAYELLVKDVAA